MTQGKARLQLLPLTAVLLLLAATVQAGDPPADAANGERIAVRWCASCHAVEASPERAPADGVPSFRAIASRPGYHPGSIKTFLAMPHAPMPNLSLSRVEIADLSAYLDRLHAR